MLKRIRLALARTPDAPEGNPACGYEIVAPLDAAGYLDAKGWREKRALCRVRRFWTGEEDETGRLVHQAGGANGATWKIDYDPNSTDDDETGYRLGSHRFMPGDYVSIRDDEGSMHTFRVERVDPA
jgi:hypothetical protein